MTKPATTTIKFKADPETVEALERLEKRARSGFIRGLRSVTMRRLILGCEPKRARELAAGALKHGRPTNEEGRRADRIVVHFLADAEVLAKLEVLVSEAGKGRSAVLRGLILEADGRMENAA